jgi:hypothetical protein
MEIVETPIFTRQLQEALTPEEYRLFQLFLATRPDAGAVIRGGGGIRKIRWVTGGTGKRGGVRIIYYWAVQKDILLMLYLYPKSEMKDITRDQLKVLRAVVEREYE